MSPLHHQTQQKETILQQLKEEKAQREHKKRRKEKQKALGETEERRSTEKKKKKGNMEERRSKAISKEFISASEDSDFDLESSRIGLKATETLSFQTPRPAVAKKSAINSSQRPTRRARKSSEGPLLSNCLSPTRIKTEGQCSASSQSVLSPVSQGAMTDQHLAFSNSESEDSHIEVKSEVETDRESDDIFETAKKLSASHSLSKRRSHPHESAHGKQMRKSSASVKSRQMGQSDYGIETGTANDTGAPRSSSSSSSSSNNSNCEGTGHLKRKRLTSNSSASDRSVQERRPRKKPLHDLLSSDCEETGEDGPSDVLTVSPVPSSSTAKHSSTIATANSTSMYLLASSGSSDSDVEVVKRKPTSRRKLWSDKESGAASDNDSDDFQRTSAQPSAHRTVRLRKRKIGRRVRRGFLSESEEESDSDKSSSNSSSGDDKEKTPVQTTPGKRKDIKKLIPETKLATETKLAQKAERERLKRLEERQKQLGTAGDGEQLILEQDSETKEVKLEVRSTLLGHLLKHQRDGIKFLYNCCCEDLERLKKEEGSGAILAHCMGLGKTLQVSVLQVSTTRHHVHSVCSR